MTGAGESAPTQPTQTVEAITTVESLNAHLGQLDAEVNNKLRQIEGLIARVDAYAKSPGADPRLAYQMRQRLQQTISGVSTQNDDIRFNMNRLRAMLSRQATGMLEKLDYAADAITLFAPAWEHLRNGRFQQGFRDFLRYGRLLINAFFGKGEIPQARQTSGETPAETVQQNITSLNNIRNLDQMAVGSDGYANHQVGNDQWRAKYNGTNLVLEKRVNNNFTVQENPTTQPLHRYLEQPENKRDLGRLMEGASGDTNNKRLQLAVKLTKVQKLMGTSKNAIQLTYERRASLPGAGDLVDKITRLTDAELKTRLEAAANSAAALGEAYTRVPQLNELTVGSDNKLTFKLPNVTTEYRINKDGTGLQQKPAGQAEFADYTINDQTPVALRSVRDYLDGIKNDLGTIASKLAVDSVAGVEEKLAVVLMEAQVRENASSNNPKLNIADSLKNVDQSVEDFLGFASYDASSLDSMRRYISQMVIGLRSRNREVREGLQSLSAVTVRPIDNALAAEGKFAFNVASSSGGTLLFSVKYDGSEIKQHNGTEYVTVSNPQNLTKLHYFLRTHRDDLGSLATKLLNGSHESLTNNETNKTKLAAGLVKHQKGSTDIDVVKTIDAKLNIYLANHADTTRQQVFERLQADPNDASRAMLQEMNRLVVPNSNSGSRGPSAVSTPAASVNPAGTEPEASEFLSSQREGLLNGIEITEATPEMTNAGRIPITVESGEGSVQLLVSWEGSQVFRYDENGSTYDRVSNADQISSVPRFLEEHHDQIEEISRILNTGSGQASMARLTTNLLKHQNDMDQNESQEFDVIAVLENALLSSEASPWSRTNLEDIRTLLGDEPSLSTREAILEFRSNAL